MTGQWCATEGRKRRTWMKAEGTDNPIHAEDPALPQAYRQILGWPVVILSVVTALVAAAMLSVLGPLGIEDGLTLVRRLTLVAIVSAICWPFCLSLAAVVLYLTRFQPPFQIATACAVGTLCMTVPCTAVAYTVYGLLRPDDAPHLEVADIYKNLAVFLFAWSALVHYVACQRAKLWLATSAILGIPVATPAPSGVAVPQAGTAAARDVEAGRRNADDAQTETAAQLNEGASSRFFERLPNTLGRDIVFLNVSGHYINVVTTTGSCLVLMRFADAIAELASLGMQVHRSYWVAHRHITGILRRDERTLVRLTGRYEVPVSRTHLATVRAALATLKSQRDSAAAH